ncbi:helix-turn-helix domain-containing protein [Streptomyces sp. NPDC002851]
MSPDSIPLFRPARPKVGPDTSPTAALIVVGTTLRDLRGDLKQGQAAKLINVSGSTISRMERAEIPADVRNIRDLARAYKAPQGRRDELDLLANRALEPEWYVHRLNDCTPSYARRLFGLESQAIFLMSYESTVVPGLLQTPAYARHVFSTGLRLDEEEELRLRVELRQERQQRVFGQEQPPQAIFLIDESVLYRRAGSDEVMVEQMRRLLELSDGHGITIRFVKLDSAIASNAAGAGTGSMTHLQFGRGGLPDLVYLEGYDEASYRTKEDDLERHVALLLRLSDEACATRAESREMLAKAIKRFSA